MSRVLITGSNSGFGRLAALGFARAGHHVVATMRNLDKGEALRKDAAAEGLAVEVRRLDVCDPASVSSGVGDPGELDVIVNNAGFEVQGSLALVDDDLLRRQLDTNVGGPLRLIRTVLPAWSARGSGTIVNVSSVAGIVGVPYGGAYSASKFALEGLSEALHYEVGPVGIRVRLVEPGMFETEFEGNVISPGGWDGSADQDRYRRFRESLAVLGGDGSPADPQDVADAIIAAATEADAPFRTVVGADAQLIQAVRSAGTFEQFEQTMRSTLDWWE